MFLSVQNQMLIYTTLLSSLSFFCLYSPSVILKQGTILLLSDALQLPHYPYNALSLSSTGLLIGVLALMYFAIYVRRDVGFLSAITPLRFLMSSGICAWSYTTSNPAIGNGLIFAFGFGDMVFQFWMYATLRQESGNKSRPS